MRKIKITINFFTIGIAFGIIGFILLFIYNVIDTQSEAFKIIHNAIPNVFIIFLTSLFTQMCRGRIKDLIYLSAGVTYLDFDKFSEENELSDSPKTEFEWLTDVSNKPRLTKTLEIIFRVFIVPNVLLNCMAIAGCFTGSLDSILNKALMFVFVLTFITMFICIIIQFTVSRLIRR